MVLGTFKNCNALPMNHSVIQNGIGLHDSIAMQINFEVVLEI
jgi:hypothetical protein